MKRAEYVEDLDIADRADRADRADSALGAIRTALLVLAATPLLSRKAGVDQKPLRRELVVPFGGAGYIVEYEVAGPELIVDLAVRHQREEDLH